MSIKDLFPKQKDRKIRKFSDFPLAIQHDPLNHLVIKVDELEKLLNFDLLEYLSIATYLAEDPNSIENGQIFRLGESEISIDYECNFIQIEYFFPIEIQSDHRYGIGTYALAFYVEAIASRLSIQMSNHDFLLENFNIYICQPSEKFQHLLVAMHILEEVKNPKKVKLLKPFLNFQDKVLEYARLKNYPSDLDTSPMHIISPHY